MGIRIDLLSNASATGTATLWPGGFGCFMVVGTFSGATVDLQYLGPDASTYTSVGANTTVTAAGGGNFLLPPCMLKAVVTSGPPSGMYASAVGMHP